MSIYDKNMQKGHQWQNYRIRSVRFVVLTKPATDEILELHFVTLIVFAGLAQVCSFLLTCA